MTSQYHPQIDRRTTLKWLAAGLSAPTLAAACSPGTSTVNDSLKLGLPKPITGVPYGSDPPLLEPIVTWERTMSVEQLALTAALSDVVLPETGDLPAGSAVGVPDFIDEWVSSPYSQTQDDRERCFELFEWLESECILSSNIPFAASTIEVQAALLDRIAWKNRVEAGLEHYAQSFDRFRNLAVSAFFASEQGSFWLGYRGNRPSTGDYAGPTDEALAHLQAALEPLGLEMPKGL